MGGGLHFGHSGRDVGYTQQQQNLSGRIRRQWDLLSCLSEKETMCIIQAKMMSSSDVHDKGRDLGTRLVG